MNGVAECLICKRWTSDWIDLGLWSGKRLYVCDEHEVEGRKQMSRLRKSEAALRNAAAKKRKRS